MFVLRIHFQISQVRLTYICC